METTKAKVGYLFTAGYIALCACVSAILIQTGNAVYEAGTGDHLVISPAGLLRNDSSLYLNDYFVREARMPHWAFEIYTAVGSRLGLLGPMYFAYWLTAISFCSYAHLVISRHVSRKFSYALALIMLTTQVMGTRTMFGTSAVVLNQALPHSLAASIGFLVLAFLLTKRRNLVFIYLPILPLIHIQIGTIVVFLVGVLVVLERVSGQPIKRQHVALYVTSLVSVLFGLSYRPIAGNIQDFSRLCRDLAPHHCYAPSWSSSILEGCFIILTIAMIGTVLIGKSVLNIRERVTLYLLPLVALTISLILDRNNFGWLADFIRGNNVYRVAVVLLPWVYWVPVFLIFSKGRKIWRYGGALISAVLLVQLMSLGEHGNYFESRQLPLFLLLVFITAIACVEKYGWFRDFRYVPALMVILASFPGLSGLKLGQDQFSMPKTTFQPDRNVVEFGEALRLDVTVGQIVVGDPRLSWIRMASGVAYGVDCKFRPIGGGPPLYEYYDRVNPLGGYDKACNQGSFSTVNVNSLIEYIEASSADLLLISSDDLRLQELKLKGWQVEHSVHMRPFGLVLVSKT